jgi:hypothetical protein
MGRYLTALSPIENAPQCKVFSERFESVLYSRSHEQEVTGFKRILLPVVQEDAPAPNNDVDLVLDVRSLLVWRDGARELHVARAALQYKRRALTRRAWNGCLDLC